jgi:hypothetical protein
MLLKTILLSERQKILDDKKKPQEIHCRSKVSSRRKRKHRRKDDKNASDREGKMARFLPYLKRRQKRKSNVDANEEAKISKRRCNKKNNLMQEPKKIAKIIEDRKSCRRKKNKLQTKRFN